RVGSVSRPGWLPAGRSRVTGPRVARGMRAQLAGWRSRVAGGAARVGWKIGFNSPAAQQQLGLDGTVVGHLTQATVLAPGTSHSLAGSHLVCAEPASEWLVPVASTVA